MDARQKTAAKPKTPTRESIKKAADKADKRSKKEAAKKQAGTAKKAFVSAADKALFLHHLPKIAEGKTAITVATNALRTLYKTAKIDGFAKLDFDDAFSMQGAEGEKKKKAAIARSLTIARWLGYDLGSQLDMFVEDERVPAADRAYTEGQTASMKGLGLKCDYHEATEQFREFTRGYHDDQEQRIKGGIKKTDEAPAFEDTSPITSGVAMTRQEFQKQQASSHKAN